MLILPLAGVLALAGCASSIDARAQCEAMLANADGPPVNPRREPITVEQFMAGCVPAMTDMNRQIDINAWNNFTGGFARGVGATVAAQERVAGEPLPAYVPPPRLYSRWSYPYRSPSSYRWSSRWAR